MLPCMKCRAAQYLGKVFQIGFNTLSDDLVKRLLHGRNRLFPCGFMHNNFRQHGIIKWGDIDTALNPGLNARSGWKPDIGQ